MNKRKIFIYNKDNENNNKCNYSNNKENKKMNLKRDTITGRVMKHIKNQDDTRLMKCLSNLKK